MENHQTAREGTQAPVRRSRFDEGGHQEEEDYFFDILEEERQHWCEVERAQDQIKEAKCCASASKIEKEDSWASSLWMVP